MVVGQPGIAPVEDYAGGRSLGVDVVTSAPSAWVSVVPSVARRSDMVAVGVAAFSMEVVFGAEVMLDRWVQGQWEPMDAVALMSGRWSRPGWVSESGNGPVATTASGLLAFPDCPFFRWLRVDLAEGTYRLRPDDRFVGGVFTVIDQTFARVDWPAVPDGPVLHTSFESPNELWLDVDCGVDEPTADTCVDAALTAVEAFTTQVGPAAGPAEISIWSGSGWQHVHTTDIGRRDPFDEEGIGELAVRVPRLAPGAYRISCRFTVAGRLHAPFVVS
jgi:hypothetical protein